MKKTELQKKSKKRESETPGKDKAFLRKVRKEEDGVLLLKRERKKGRERKRNRVELKRKRYRYGGERKRNQQN